MLGKGWENHVEGQKLKQDGDSFRQKLNTQQLFDDWKKKVEARQLVVQGRIFNIVSQRTRTGTILKLQVNFTPETITLAKEVGDSLPSISLSFSHTNPLSPISLSLRSCSLSLSLSLSLSRCACVQVRNFKWLNFRVPFSIVNQANQANQLYPHAVSLMESIRTYELMCTKVYT